MCDVAGASRTTPPKDPLMSTSRTDPYTAADPRRWLALGVIAVAQLMVVLDASIVNIALPSAQHALHISDANRQWVVTAYALAFGGLLLLGGRIADFIGRKRAFVIGLVGFGVASAIGGTRPEPGRAVRRPRPAGRLRRADGAGRAVADHRDLHRAARAGQGLRRLRRHLRRRRRARPDPRRRAHRVRLLALDPAGQHPDRHRDRRRRPCSWCARAAPRASRATTSPA